MSFNRSYLVFIGIFLISCVFSFGFLTGKSLGVQKKEIKNALNLISKPKDHIYIYIYK